MTPNDDIPWRYVAMDHTALMCVVERGKNLVHVAEHRWKRHADRFQDPGQRLAFQKFHDQRQIIAEPKGSMDCRNVGMVQTGLHLDFTEKTIGLLFGTTMTQYLHRFQAAGNNVFDLVHFAHAADARDRNDPVITDDLSDVKAHR